MSSEEAADPLADLPPFYLQPVLDNVFRARDLLDFGPDTSQPVTNVGQQPLNLFSLVSGTASAANRRAQAIASAKSAEEVEANGNVVLRCVEGYGNNLYLGSSDGVVYWYTIDGSGPSTEGAFKLRNKHMLFPRRPVSKIILMPVVGKALVLSDGTLSFFTLPTLDPVPSALINPIRGVVTAVIDDAEMDADTDKPAEMGLCVIKRKSIMLFRLGARLMTDKDVIQEIPLPNGATTASRTRTTLCIAESVDKLYNMIDLENAQLWPLLPYSQIDPSVADFDVTPSIAVVPGEREFLVTSYTGTGTIGIFLTAAGDPTRGTLEWESHPIAITLEAEFIIALCRDNTVVIHSINQPDKALQTITLPMGFEALGVVSSPYGISIPNTVRDQRMRLVSIPLLAQITPAPRVESEASGSGLTPPSSPKQSAAAPFSTTIAETLIVGLNAVYALAPVPTIVQLEDLLSRRKLDEAVTLVDEERRRGKRGEIDVDKNTHAATMRLLHLRLACALFSDTRFAKAGDYFTRGKIDVRLLVRLFPRIRGKVIGSAEEVEVFAALEAPFREMDSVDEIINRSLRRNYDPHIEPDADTAPETAELRSVLLASATSMLTDFLRKTRVARRKGGGARGVDSRKIDIVLDTALAKLLADADSTDDLLALLAAPNDVVLSELEPFLENRKYILSKVMQQQGRLDRVFTLLREIADGAPDKHCTNPVREIATLLKTTTDEALLRDNGLWLIGHDLGTALEIFTTATAKFDDVSLIDDMRAISAEAAERYLEHVVVRRRSPIRDLHEALLVQLLDAVNDLVHDDGVRYHFEELESEYRLLAPQSFAQFFADVAPNTLAKTARLKLILFLQGSPFYALDAAANRLGSMDFVIFERAIVQGRLAHHSQALALLAQDLGDSISAQTYCTLGEVLPPKVTRAIAHRMPELSAWATLGDVGRKRRPAVEPHTQDALVMELLRVYMRDGASKAPQAAALLNAQARHLDVGAVLEIVPDEWDLKIVSSFLTRSLRRQSHERASWQILKSITAGQNLQTTEKYLEAVPHRPYVIERPSPGESFSSMRPSEGSIAEKEYTSIDEKREGFPLEPKERVEPEQAGGRGLYNSTK